MFHQAQATDYIDLLVQLEDLVANSHVDTLAINVAGTGWAVGDLFDINGGTVVGGLNATGEVLAEAGGVPSSIRLYNGGAYTANPGVAATTTALGASTGINLTVDTTILTTGWSVDRSAIYDSPERELLLRGIGSGSDEIFVSAQTARNVPNGNFYWQLAGATGFDNLELWEDQPDSTMQNDQTNDLVVALNNGIIDYFFQIDSYHITGVFKSGSSYTNCYMGFINTFATANEYPYPLAVIGCVSNRTTAYNSSTEFMSGMHDPRSISAATDGPGALREVDGQWYEMWNVNGPSTAQRNNIGPKIWPAGHLPNNSTNHPDQADRYMAEHAQETPPYWFGDYSSPGVAPLYQLTPTPGTVPIPFLWPTMIYQVDPSRQFLGELIDVNPVIVKDIGAVSEDTVTLPNGDTYILFQNCNRTDSWTFFALKRNF